LIALVLARTEAETLVKLLLVADRDELSEATEALAPDREVLRDEIELLVSVVRAETAEPVADKEVLRPLTEAALADTEAETLVRLLLVADREALRPAVEAETFDRLLPVADRDVLNAAVEADM